MNCTNCGSAISEGAKFCGKCGQKVIEQNQNGVAQNTLENKKPRTSAGTILKIFQVIAIVLFVPALSTISSDHTGRSGLLEDAHNLFTIAIAITFFALLAQWWKNRKTDKQWFGWRLVSFLIILSVVSLATTIFSQALITARQKGIQNGLANSWQTYNSDSEKFSVLFPKVPTVDNSHDLTQDNPDATSGYVRYKSNPSDQTIYSIFKYKYASEIDTSDPDTLLKNMLNGIVSSDSSNNLESSNYTDYAGYRALDHVVKNKDEYIKGRLILVGQNPYWLALECVPAYCNDSEYQKFVDSLQLK